eukprot:20544-Heterococcus_DN1.PRE.2
MSCTFAIHCFTFCIHTEQTAVAAAAAAAVMCRFASSCAAAPNNQSMYILPAKCAYHLFNFLFLLCFVLCECGYVGDDAICANELVQYAYVHPCKEMQCLLCSSASGVVDCSQACIVQQSIIKQMTRTTRTLVLQYE